ncbi:MAG: acetyl-CoA carboxylase, carboxyltransferase subunit beta [Magnetococcus sp. WYHC-3]
MNWFARIIKPKIKADATRREPPQGLWIKCPSCGQALFQKDLERNLNVCRHCDHHFRVSAMRRLDLTLDRDNRVELFAQMEPGDPLKFRDRKRYRDRIKEAQAKTGTKDAVRVFKGTIQGIPAVVTAFEFNFMGGSMGSVVGAKIAQGALVAVENRSGYVVFSASGGARMQEGILSLMQMGRTAAALTRLEEAGLPFISVLTDPTSGGVTASFAMLGDVIVAEPGALICFAGPRVIQQTVRETLPEGFQRSEYLLEHGFLDLICSRHDLRALLGDLLSRFTASRHLRVVEEPITRDKRDARPEGKEGPRLRLESSAATEDGPPPAASIEVAEMRGSLTEKLLAKLTSFTTTSADVPEEEEGSESESDAAPRKVDLALQAAQAKEPARDPLPAPEAETRAKPPPADHRIRPVPQRDAREAAEGGSGAARQPADHFRDKE